MKSDTAGTKRPETTEGGTLPWKQESVVPGIRRNVFLLGLVSLFNDISSEMLYPLVPIFLTAVLGTPIAIVGVIEGIAESTASLLKTFSGWYSDRVRKRRFLVIAGYGLSAVSKPFLTIAQSWGMVLGVRFADRFGKGIRTSARDALIADSSDAGSMGRSFGFHRAMDTLGAVLGPLIALGILALLGTEHIGDSLRMIFLLASIPAIIGVLLLFLVREKPREAFAQAMAPGLGLSQFGWEFKLFLFITLIFSLGNSSDVFLILRAQDLGFSAMMIVLVYAFYNVFYSAISAPAGILSDRVGRRSVMAVGFLIFALVYFGFALIGEALWVWPLFAIYGFYIAMTEGVGKAFAVDMVTPNKRGTALGMYHTAIGLMTFFASTIAGILWSLWGPPATFGLGGITALVAAGLLFLLPAKPRAQEEAA